MSHVIPLNRTVESFGRSSDGDTEQSYGLMGKVIRLSVHPPTEESLCSFSSFKSLDVAVQPMGLD